MQERWKIVGGQIHLEDMTKNHITASSLISLVYSCSISCIPAFLIVNMVLSTEAMLY